MNWFQKISEQWPPEPYHMDQLEFEQGQRQDAAMQESRDQGLAEIFGGEWKSAPKTPTTIEEAKLQAAKGIDWAEGEIVSYMKNKGMVIDDTDHASHINYYRRTYFFAAPKQAGAHPFVSWSFTIRFAEREAPKMDCSVYVEVAPKGNQNQAIYDQAGVLINFRQMIRDALQDLDQFWFANGQKFF